SRRHLTLIPETKNGSPRHVVLTAHACAVLNKLPRLEQRIFPISPLAVRQAWLRAAKRASIENFRFHDLRHEALSRFFEAGLSVPEAALMSGHKDVRMLFRYVHPEVERIRAKLDRRPPQ